MADMTFTTAAAQLKLQRMRQMLQGQPMTVHQVAEAVPISRRWAQAYINHLKGQGQVYIQSWCDELVDGRRYPRPVYASIPADAPKPEAKDAVQSKREWRQRVMADPDLHHRELMKQRARRLRKKPRADVAAAWLFRGAA